MTSYRQPNIYNVVYNIQLLETDVNNYKTHLKEKVFKKLYNIFRAIGMIWEVLKKQMSSLNIFFSFTVTRLSITSQKYLRN